MKFALIGVVLLLQAGLSGAVSASEQTVSTDTPVPPSLVPASVPASAELLRQKNWLPKSTTNELSVWLLSGPTDNWRSDSAWFARLGPHLANNGYRASAFDRAGLFSSDASVRPGYCPFGRSLAQKTQSLNGDYAIVAFASANLAVRCMLSADKVVLPKFVILLDPDGLTEFTISRYSADARPYAEHLAEYQQLINSGGYQQRATEVNKVEYEHLRKLAGDDPLTDWEYVDSVFAERLKPGYQLGLVADIASYAQDLAYAKEHPLPTSVPLLILDTAFEDHFINQQQDAKEKEALTRWRDESSEWFKQQTRQQRCGYYVPSKSEEHLLPFSKPLSIVNWVRQLDQQLKCE